MKECELLLHWPPSVNNYKRIGKIIRTKNGKLYQQRLNFPSTNAFYWLTALQIRVEGLCGLFSGDIRLQVAIMLNPPDKRRHDVDNRCKLILDALQRGGLFVDDYQVARLIVERGVIIPGGMVAVTVSEMSNE